MLRGKLSRGRIIKHEDKNYKKQFFAVIVNYYQEYNSIWCLSAENDQKIRIQYEEEEEKINPNSKITINSNIKFDDRFKSRGIHNGNYYHYFELNEENIIDVVDVDVKIDQKELVVDSEGYMFLQRNCLDKYLNFLFDFKQKANSLKNLDYEKSSKNDIKVFDLVDKKNKIEERMLKNKCQDCHLKKEHLINYSKRRRLEVEYEKEKKVLSEENLNYFKEFNIRLKIMKHFGFIDNDAQIELKGRASREINTTDCIVITQLLTSNILNDLNDAEMVSFLSGFAFNKSEIDFEDPNINKNFTNTIEKFKVIFEEITKVEFENEFEENKYNRKITFCTSKAIYNWMNGASFKNILEDSDLEEGKLFNLIMRLYLFLDEIRNFFNTLGNQKLAERFLNARTLLIKDILSCKSLYTQDEIDIDSVE
jgi:superfamily II RNA helicase